jgi:hypothetical protein
MTDLSPAAQAILAACGCPDTDSPFRLVARGFAGAAIRAVADQVVPVEPEPPELPFASVNDPWPSWNAKQNIRHNLIAIAAELETV